MNSGNVKVKGHRTQFDDSDNDKDINNEFVRHNAAPADSEDERNTRHIKVSTKVGYRGLSPNKLNLSTIDVEGDASDSVHDYEFIIKDKFASK